MTIGETFSRFWRWWNTRKCRRANHTWCTLDGPLPENCPTCEAEKALYPTVKNMTTGELTCGRPPRGWNCTRGPHADGPCAAVRDPLLPEKVPHIECETYTDYTPLFGLCKEQLAAANKWMEEHDKERHIRPGKTYRYSGAIGGAYTWTFTPTSLGTVARVECSCGAEIDVTDYDW